MHKTQLKHKRTCFVIARDIDLYALAVALLAEHLSKRNRHRAFEESLLGALELGNLQKNSGKKGKEPRGCLAGLFLVNVMENAKSLSCSLFLLLSLSSSFSLSSCWLVLCCQCGIADFPSHNWVKRALSFHLGRIIDQSLGHMVPVCWSLPSIAEECSGRDTWPPHSSFNT